MAAEHPLGDLAPRDIVARAVWRRQQKGERVLLDARALFASKGASAFPTISRLCEPFGLDPVRQPIPISPAAHYHMGGVWTDECSRTTVSGLWACGEVACTGVHGANRLASNSLLEALVFGGLAAEDIDETLARQAGRWNCLAQVDRGATADRNELDTDRSLMRSDPDRFNALLQTYRELAEAHDDAYETYDDEAITAVDAFRKAHDLERVGNAEGLVDAALVEALKREYYAKRKAPAGDGK